ncbi:phosphatase PAP2 family protein [Candidatus Berkelbacteria bacterium]|nr:phosphatase PAP2 family protein [Candidatus Berkelbacteria bacterium]
METILALDQKISESLVTFTQTSGIFYAVAKLGARWLVYFVPLAVLLIWFFNGPREKITAVRVTIAGLFGWLVVNSIIGHFFFRTRPSLNAAKELLFHLPDKSFPSDHATLGFALAFGFWLAGYRKISLFFLILTLTFATLRVFTGLHFTTDVLGGLIVGFVMAWVGQWLKRPFDRYIGEPLMKVAKLLRLA